MAKAAGNVGKMATPKPRSKGMPMGTPKTRPDPKRVGTMATPKPRKGG